MTAEQSLVDIRLWSRFTRGIMAVLLAAGFLVGGVLILSSTWKQKTQWEESLLRRGGALVRSLGRAAFVPLVLEDVAALDALTEGFMDEMDVVYVALYSPQGNILSQRPSGAAIGPLSPASGTGGGSLPAASALPGFGGISVQRQSSSGRAAVWDLALPLRYRAGPAEVPASGPALKGGPEGGDASGVEVSGYARIGLTEERLRRQLRAVVWNNLALSLGLTLAAFGVAAFLVRRMTRQMRDFIEQVQMTAELRRSNKELEAFSYSVSHDLRTPLRAIDGFSHALLEDYADRLDDQGKDYLQRVRAGCGRMGQLIDDLLALSRVIRQEMRWEEVDLAALARSVAGPLAQAEPGRRVEFTVSGRALVRGDPGLLRIVLENLLGNAWKFTRKKPDARIEFGVQEKDGRRVVFVRDDGAGFDMAYAGKLFGAFQRLHEASDFPGTGIGLATVQRIIERHGGRIWAEGTVGQGAAFYFTLRTAEEK